MRLIDADALPVKTDWDKQYVLYTAVEDAPTIDAVPVVRCRDCEMQSSCKVAQHLGNDGFCSKGERRDDDA